jgi:aminotransferase
VAKFGLAAKEFALELLREEKVAVVPGTAFGACGEGFVRCAYATSLDNIKEAMTRLRRFISRR